MGLDYEHAVFNVQKRATLAQFMSAVLNLNDILSWGPFAIVVSGTPGLAADIQRGLFLGGVGTIVGAAVRLRAQVQAEQEIERRTGQVHALRARAGVPARSTALPSTKRKRSR